MSRSLHSPTLVVEIGVCVDGNIRISLSNFFQFVSVNLHIQIMTVDIDRIFSFMLKCSVISVFR